MKKFYAIVFFYAVFMLLFNSTSAVSAEFKTIPDNIVPSVVDQYFDSYAFQKGISHNAKLSDLAAAHLNFTDDPVAYGFAAKSPEARIFVIGTLYSECLAYFQSAEPVKAAQRLRAIQKQFVHMAVPESLFNYISKVHYLVLRNAYPKDALADFLSCLQPFLEDYCRAEGRDELTLFRAGTWLVDMALSSAAGDAQRLCNPGKLDFFITELERMAAPQGVMTALNRIKEITNKPDVTKRDFKKIMGHLTAIQSMLI